MTDKNTHQIAAELKVEIETQMQTTIDTKTVDRGAFRDMFLRHGWTHLPNQIHSDQVSDGEWLSALRSVHEDVVVWAMEGLGHAIDGFKKGDFIEIPVQRFAEKADLIEFEIPDNFGPED